jgi:hypothetical protein
LRVKAKSLTETRKLFAINNVWDRLPVALEPHCIYIKKNNWWMLREASWLFENHAQYISTLSGQNEELVRGK